MILGVLKTLTLRSCLPYYENLPAELMVIIALWPAASLYEPLFNQCIIIFAIFIYLFDLMLFQPYVFSM